VHVWGQEIKALFLAERRLFGSDLEEGKSFPPEGNPGGGTGDAQTIKGGCSSMAKTANQHGVTKTGIAGVGKGVAGSGKWTEQNESEDNWR